jgi:hypothetical protein
MGLSWTVGGSEADEGATILASRRAVGHRFRELVEPVPA